MKRLIRPAMLLVPLISGVCFPGLHIFASAPYNFIRWALCVMIFINVLQIEVRDLKPCREHFIVLAANILIGVVPFFLLKYIYPASVIPAQAAFFAGIAPTAAAAAVIVSLLNGRVGFVVTGFMISNIGISIALLFLLPVVTGNLTAAFFLTVLESLVTVIAIPLTAAQIVRRFFPGILKYRGKLKSLTLVLWSLSLLIIASVAGNFFRNNAGNSTGFAVFSVVLAFLICAGNFSIGYWLGRPGYRRDTSQMLGQKNTTFAIFIALEYSGGAAALTTIAYVLFHNLWNSIQLFTAKSRNNSDGNDLKKR
ncbi:MAG: hypothetical protein IKD23_08110 [Lentisphaeria bacterium]|nr:hypothetical protein [Lentisphaeria bacterium]